MPRVQLTSTTFGVFQDKAGNARQLRTASITDLDGDPVTVYEAATGATEVTALVTNTRGELPGWVEVGSYLGDDGEREVQFEAYSGATLASVEGGSARAINANAAPYNARPGSGTPAAAIQAAIEVAAATGVGTVEVATPGVYALEATISMRSNVTLKGAPGVEFDITSVPSDGTYRYGIKAVGTTGTALSLTANAVTGNISVSLSAPDAATLAAGDLVVLGSTADYYPYFLVGNDVDRGEIKEVHSISGTTVTFKEAVYDDYPTAKTAFVRKITAVENVTIENLRITSTTTATASATLEQAVHLSYVDGFRIANIDGKVKTATVWATSSIRGEITGCRTACPFWDGTGSNGIFSGIAIYNACQWVRVHHNHGQELRHLCLNSSNGNGQGWWGQPRFISFDHNIAKDMFDNGGRVWAFEHHGFGEAISYIGNIADGCRGLINIEGGNVLIANNTVRNWQIHAIEVQPDAEFIRNVVIKDNLIGARMKEPSTGLFYPSSRAVYLDLTNVLTLDNLVIDGNVIQFDNSAFAVIETVGAIVGANVVIANNVIRYTSPNTSSYAIETNCSGVTIRNNVIYDAPFGIRPRNSNTRVIANEIVNSAAPTAGIGIRVDQADIWVLKNVVRKGFRGVQLLAGATGALIEGNVLEGTNMSTALADAGTGSIIKNNLIVNAPTNVSAVAALVLPFAQDVVGIQGTADITSIDATGNTRRVVTLRFTGTAATSGVVDGSNLKLASNFLYTPDDTLTLYCDGTNWYETARSVN